MRNPFPDLRQAERAAFIICRYPFIAADDVEIYLSLLQSVPDYVQGLLSYESGKKCSRAFYGKRGR